MSLSDNEVEYLERVFQALQDHRAKLSDWQKGFMDDQLDRWEKYGQGLRLSPKQWMALHKAAEVMGVYK